MGEMDVPNNQEEGGPGGSDCAGGFKKMNLVVKRRTRATTTGMMGPHSVFERKDNLSRYSIPSGVTLKDWRMGGDMKSPSGRTCSGARPRCLAGQL